ncbi:uncharacterized protein LOC122852270 [Aphidius gifuensis]|uniref:uncharacterized protein LOC122852270 n=1 Tax=Aphidius gifuensis TaxID=684658 RepID=UPI001CDC88DE|nr:uncharacterized protein LOC122852270 [Aphidius gifuensis]
MKVTVDRCCCFNIRIGSIIIAGFTIVGSFIVGIFMIYDGTYGSACAPIENIIFSCFLLKGIYREKPLYMLPWLCITFSAILLGPTEIVYVIEYSIFSTQFLVHDLVSILIIITVCGIVIAAFLVVYSHFKELLMPKNRVLDSGGADPVYTILP